MGKISEGEEAARFKIQFTKEEWDKLIAIPKFAEAWAANDLVGAGEIASREIEGDFKTQRSMARNLAKYLAKYRKPPN